MQKIKSRSAKRVFSWVLIAVSLTAAVPAQAFELGALAGLDFASRTIEPEAVGTTYDGGTGFVGGAFVQFGFLPGFTWEVNALSQGRHSKATTGGNETITRVSYWTFPLIGRLWLGDFLSVGAGPYLGLVSGNVTSENRTASGSVTSSLPASSQNIGTTDFGLVASGQMKLGLAPTLSLLVDVRYVLGLTDFDKTAAATQRWRDVMILAGLSFGL
jgi:hypothetical protein